MVIEVTAALVGLVVSIFAQGYARFRRQQAQREYLSSLENVDPEELLKEFDQEDAGQRAIVAKLLSEIGDEVRAEQPNELSGSPKIQKEVERKIEEVRKRILDVETRFPNSTEIEKYASVNDALFNERLDQLGKRVERMESKILSQWDVAVVVSSVLGGIFGVVAATYAVLDFVGGT